MRLTTRILLALFVLALGSATIANADQVFMTPGGSTDTGGDPVSAMADFGVSGTTLTLTLTNTLGGIKDAGQLLTDVFFTVSSGIPTLGTQTGDLVDVGSGGAIITDLGTTPLFWGFGAATVNSISGFEACVICQGSVTALATPAEGVLGPVSADGKFDNANGSIASNPAHNPFVNNFATFTFTVPSSVTVDDVIFSFGTKAGDNVSSGPTPSVPEPGYSALLGLGVLAIGWIARRNSRRAEVTD